MRFFGFLIFVIVGMGGRAPAFAKVIPFWEKNPKVMKQVKENRKIATVVKSEPLKPSDKGQQLQLQGIGLVKAPVHYVSAWSAQFHNLKRVSDYVQEVTWKADEKVLFLHTAAFGYHARMWMDVKVEADEIRFAVKKGTFAGMKGLLGFQKNAFADSLISLGGQYDYVNWPIPRMFLEFGLEVVLQKFAERLRSLIEEDFQKGRPAVSKVGSEKEVARGS